MYICTHVYIYIYAYVYMHTHKYIYRILQGTMQDDRANSVCEYSECANSEHVYSPRECSEQMTTLSI